MVPPRLYRNDPGASTFSALVSDPDGLQDIVGGRLVDPVSGGTYGVFTASGAPGAYTYSLTWLGMQAVRGVTAAPVDGLQRDFRAEFFDVAGHTGSATVPMLIACGLTGYGVCSNQCRQLNTATDCSGCDEPIPTGGSCSMYTRRCPTGTTLCATENACADLMTSTAHCGQCGRAVATGGVCVAGVPQCPANQVVCGNKCVNLATDSQNCGTCGVAVPAAQICRNGQPACQSTSDTWCPVQNTCANLQTNRTNCGACGVVAERACAGGAPTPEWNMVNLGHIAATAPSPRVGAAMTFDGNRNTIVLFGGSDSVSFRGDTWVRTNGTSWVQLSLNPSPPARVDAGMVFDAHRNRVVLYAGAGRTDLWEIDATGWQQMSLGGTLPSGETPSTLVYDSVRQRSVVINLNTGAAWEWSGSTWVQVDSYFPLNRRPEARTSPAVAWDPVRQALVLFGGSACSTSSSSSCELNDQTWEYAL